ncbi:pre-peptidase C-terminal domain-containing protein [Coralloluteibacterium stylophorae]|uniref:Lamin tail domain-containing protein n=1 Tax=Coralloluteibacterium stylophorae TaxID=1776034 RepID=A0A8J7VUQ6_9GAMM|nr:lamin tail domain-containing protein [Coralloluteibacterium stylophorae]MBS7457894.1 lamin tail domain-containing protein [Coralloluteibacterium stylophorae]
MRTLTRLSALALGLAAVAAPTRAQVVISQVYGGGGNSGAPLDRDYVELFNRGEAPASLGGMSLQYASATGSGAFGSNLATLPAATLQPGQSFLVQFNGGSNGAPLPTPDATGNINMSASSGKVALVDSTDGLDCNGGSTPCSDAQLALIADLVGFGSANFFEGSAAAPGASNTTALLRAGDGCSDSDDNAADFASAAPAPRNSASPARPCAGGGTPALSVADAEVLADAGQPLRFEVSLSQPADAPVTFDIATHDGSAIAGTHYVSVNLDDVAIPVGQTTWTFEVPVLGNDDAGTTRTLTVDIDDLQGATGARLSATGRIVNANVELTPIGAIAPPPGTRHSPRLGATVAIEGIVTARRYNNGVFVQTAPGEEDANPQTSEGLFVYTGSAPPAEAAVGTRVQVTGVVSEYVPNAAPWQLPLTQLTEPAFTVLETGLPLPAPVELTAAEFSASAAIDAAGRYLGMRVTAPELEVVSPSNGSGVFYAVLAGQPRPFREPGVNQLVLELGGIYPDDLDPPVFDANPERIRVQSRGQVDAGLMVVDVGTGIDGMTGVLDYGFETYSLLPDADAQGTIDASAVSAEAALLPEADEFTVASYNLLGLAANDARYDAFATQVCDYLHAPDILGVSEAQSLAALQGLAEHINAVSADCQDEAPQYAARLVEGPNAAIHVGFLVNQRTVPGDMARVGIVSVTQVGAGETLPGGGVLNDRPPLVLEAVVHFDDGRSEPVTVIANHMRSLIDLEDPGAEGDRVRMKRAAQAEYLAQLIHERQQADPDERIVVLGDLNAYEFNDGYVDTVGIITGREAANDAVWEYVDSPVEVPLTDLVGLAPPAERYSYTYDGNAQNLDHVIANQAALDAFPATRLGHARLNADFAVARADDDGILRTSDHDPVIAYFGGADVPPPAEADLTTRVIPLADRVVAGEAAEFAVDVANLGPDTADAALALAVDAAPARVTVSAPLGWTCATGAEGDGSRVDCDSDEVAVSEEGQAFGVVVATGTADAGSTINLQATVTTSAIDPDSGNDSASGAVAVDAAPAPIPALGNGVLVSGLSGALGDVRVWRIELPAGARNLRVLTLGGRGDVSLYASAGEVPGPETHDLASTRPGNNETVTARDPAPGTWYVTVVGETSYDRLSIRASWSE